ncbi:MAG TPA: YfiR family protein [Lacunisphaera sp.]
MSGRRNFCLAALTISSLFATRGWGQVESNEYQLKAVFLFNFAQFVGWPEKAFADADSPIVIGVLGPDPFGPLLDETVRDERIGGRPLIIQRYRRVEEIGLCHILFISASESPHLEKILSALNGRSILTVSDADRAARRGVMVRFITEKKRVRLRINLDAAKLVGLTISSKLLRPTEIVTTEKD